MLVHRRQLPTDVAMAFMTARIFQLFHSTLALLLLLSLTMGCQAREFTLTVSGEGDAEGGDVFINGKWVGTMATEGGHGPQFVMTLPKGTLTVEVKKEGYLPFLEVITVTSGANEQEVRVKLARDADPDGKKTDAGMDRPPRSAAPPSKLPVCPD
jgi:hypothetical protein